MDGCDASLSEQNPPTASHFLLLSSDVSTRRSSTETPLNLGPVSSYPD